MKEYTEDDHLHHYDYKREVEWPWRIALTWALWLSHSPHCSYIARRQFPDSNSRERGRIIGLARYHAIINRFLCSSYEWVNYSDIKPITQHSI